jgi:hypothetical protein
MYQLQTPRLGSKVAAFLRNRLLCGAPDSLQTEAAVAETVAAARLAGHTGSSSRSLCFCCVVVLRRAGVQDQECWCLLPDLAHGLLHAVPEVDTHHVHASCATRGRRHRGFQACSREVEPSVEALEMYHQHFGWL